MLSKKKNEIQADKIHIVNISVIKNHVESPFGFLTEKVQRHDIETGFDMGLNVEDKLIKASLSLKILTSSNGQNEGEVKGDFLFVFVFHIENIDELVIKTDNKEIGINNILTTTLASITYSTVRGLLFANLKGTALDTFVLPVITPDKLIK